MRPRFCGILLHISSLPAPYGIGDLGPDAHEFARTLALKGISRWQILPLTPTSVFIGNSPYSSPSAFAGNPLLISPEVLVREGIVSYGDLDSAARCTPYGHLGSDPTRVEYEAVSAHRSALLKIAFEKQHHTLKTDADFLRFCHQEAYWLKDYTRFMSMKDAFEGANWTAWADELQWRHPEALAKWDENHKHDMERHAYIQYLFFSQWNALHEVCRSVGVNIIGDLPIYVTHDSADVWANPGLFDLDQNGKPVKVAGVPPDYFSATGQRWGNPVFRWEVMAQDKFAWWTKRLMHNLELTDMVRLDHFRGFCGYWEIPAEEETAVNGVWREAPGEALFSAFLRQFGTLPIIAEDLGVITPDVREMMRTFNLPGMKVLQFAFAGNSLENPHIPFVHAPNNVVYTGTHDNPTSREWFSQASHEERANLAAYSGREINDFNAHDALIRLAMGSPAELAVLPMQDVLGLGTDSRMNTPGTTTNNWSWRMKREETDPYRLDWIRDLCALYGRG